MSVYAALNIGIYKVKRCAIIALDPDLDTVYIAADATVGSCATRSGNEHTCTVSIDGNIFHRTDNVFSCVAAIVRFDTVGKSIALNCYIFDGTNASGRTGLEYDTANGLVGITLALNVNYKILECNCVPNLDCRGVACVNNCTVLDGRIVLDTHTAVSVASGKSLSTEVQSDCLSDSKLCCTVVNVCGQHDGVAILSCCNSCIKLSLGRNLECGTRSSEFILSVNGLSEDIILNCSVKRIALRLNFKSSISCVRTKVNLACSSVIIKYDRLACACVSVCIERVACNGYRLNVLAALVIGNCSSCTGKSRILDNDFCISEIFCACAFTENDTVSCATDNGKTVNGQALLRSDHSLHAGSFANIDCKIINRCIFFESEYGVPVVVVDSAGKLNGMTVTVNGYRFLELRVRTVCYIISAVPLVVNGYISEDVDYAAIGCSLECFLEGCKVRYIALCIGYGCNGLFNQYDLAVNDLSLELVVVNNLDGACELGEICSKVNLVACLHAGCVDDDVCLVNDGAN